MNAGKVWEQRAADYLIRQGLTPVAYNWHCRYGELDLIMRDGSCLVFVEVKYRSSGGLGSALEAVTAAKLRKMRKTASHYIYETKPVATGFRFDVVAMQSGKIHWVKGVFQ